MLEKLGKRALVLPFGMAIILCCILSLAVGPMLRAEPNNVPFGIVNLDAGASTAAGQTNAGETLTSKLISDESSLAGSSDETSDSTSNMAGAISWTQLESEKEATTALNNNELYGAIVIPSNFTSQQISSQMAQGNAPQITVYLNKGKNPQMASSMQTTIENALLQAGIACEVKVVNDANIGGGSMSSTMAVQMMAMPLFMLTMICSLLLSMLFWRNDITGLRSKNIAVAAIALLVFVAALSALAASSALFICAVAGGMTLPATDLFLFLWLASGCCMLCFTALCCLNFPLGAFIAVGIFALGMSCAMLGPEMLPQLWADWVYPWAPQAHIGNGIRSIIYLGYMPSTSETYPLLAFGIVGAAALALAAILESAKKKQRLNHK